MNLTVVLLFWTMNDIYMPLAGYFLFSTKLLLYKIGGYGLFDPDCDAINGRSTWLRNISSKN